MRAVVLNQSGADLEVRDDLPVPEPGDGEVRVHVHAASLNGFDLAVPAGFFAAIWEHRWPLVLGKDFAGTVDAVGDGVDGYAVGDRVFGVVTKPFLGDGSFGEYVTVPVSVGLAHLPDAIGWTEGAALGLAGTAARDAVAAARPTPGQTVLVVGATGGVGSCAVQLSRQAGARVLATAGTDEERAFVTAMGADEVVDRTTDVLAQVREGHPDGVDAVIHLAGDPSALLPAVRSGGRFVSTLLMSPDQLPGGDVDVVAVYANPSPETLDALADAQAHERTRVTVQRTYSLDQVPQAFADFAAGTTGKLVVTID